MRAHGALHTGLWIAATVALGCAPTTGFAGFSHDDYLSALAKAEAKAERTHAPSGTAAGAVLRRNAVTHELVGHDYRIGESWDVAAFAESSTMARKSNDPKDLPHLLPPEKRPGHAGLFHYEVTAVGTSGVTVRITQRDPIADPRVEALSLTFDSHMQEIDKVYTLTGVANPVRVSPDGVHSRVSRLELFPLDPTELESAEHTATGLTPALPAPLSPLVSSSFPSMNTLSEFHQEDFFGRPVRVLWRQGDPWPTYVNTINGTAVLVDAKGAR